MPQRRCKGGNIKMALFDILGKDGKRKFCQIPGEDSLFTRMRVEQQIGEIVTTICPKSCWETKCKYHSRNPGCNNDVLLEQYKKFLSTRDEKGFI